MTLFLAIQNNYDIIEMALFRATTMIDSVQISKFEASKLIFTALDDLCTRNSIALKDLTFCAVNQGPGPFTTLRVVIAAVNGISFASHLPLIGIDALKALLTEHRDIHYPHTVALLNAFNKDVYFAREHNNAVQTGSMNIITILEEIKRSAESTQTIRFIGNATALYAHEITTLFGSQAYIPLPLPETCSISSIAHQALERWHAGDKGVTILTPLYLKQFRSA